MYKWQLYKLCSYKILHTNYPISVSGSKTEYFSNGLFVTVSYNQYKEYSRYVNKNNYWIL